jgi:hypothetical protein
MPPCVSCCKASLLGECVLATGHAGACLSYIHYCTDHCHRDVAHQPPPFPMQSLRHLHSAITVHIEGCGSLETALQAEQCQMAGGGEEEYCTAQ